MDTARPSLFARDDTFFGICQGLGEDLRVNPDLLRVALIPALFFYPVQTLAAYFGAGTIVLLSRLLFPATPRRGKTARVQETPAVIAQPALSTAEESLERLAA